MELEPIVVFVTCGSEEEALKISNALVNERLAACVNLISPIRSIYRWEGKIWDEKEWLLIIKTQKKK
jgi:periplasmic divalent cation tolerance protein